MVGGEIMAPCDRLPIALEICPCCGGGIKPTRGFTWIEPYRLFKGDHGTTQTVGGQPAVTYGCTCDLFCPVCFPSRFFINVENGEGIKAGLLWIGKQHYPTPKDFLDEGATMGISRRINSIPREFVLGQTWVFFAHLNAIENNGNVIDDPDADKYTPGIFSAFLPKRFERIVKQSEFDAYTKLAEAFKETDSFELEYNQKKGFAAFLDLQDDCGDLDLGAVGWMVLREDGDALLALRRDVERGITLVPVPDDDPDHQ